MWWILLLVTGLTPPAEGVKFFAGSFEDALGEAKKSKKSVFIDFYTDW